VAAALAVFAVLVPPLVSLERLRASATALRQQQPVRALELAEESVDAEPFAASPYVQRALVHEARGDLPAAEADLREAVERERTNWRHRVLLARVAARGGDAAEMDAQLAAARRLSPNSPLLQEGSPLVVELTALARAGR
jgi:Flp pilus assembly protein TadD